MPTIVKICKHHGSLTEDQVNINKSNGRPAFRCKQCQKESHAKHFQKNKAKILQKVDKYRKKDPAKWKEAKRLSWLKNKQNYHAKKKMYDLTHYYKDHKASRLEQNRSKRKNSQNLSDGYVVQQIVKTIGLKRKEITKDIIDIKRVMIQIKRISNLIKRKK